LSYGVCSAQTKRTDYRETSKRRFFDAGRVPVPTDNLTNSIKDNRFVPTRRGHAKRYALAVNDFFRSFPERNIYRRLFYVSRLRRHFRQPPSRTVHQRSGRLGRKTGRVGVQISSGDPANSIDFRCLRDGAVRTYRKANPYRSPRAL